LADFARGTKQRILWYRIDEDDSNWVTFTQHVVAAGREVDRTFAPNTVELLADASAKGRTTSGVLGAFLSELNGLVSATPTVLILDDYHLVDGVPEIREFMKGLVARAPVGLTLIIAGRRTPSVPLSRLRAMGDVAELRSDDLRFQPAETDRLFRETYRREIEADIVADVARRTEGWAASLQLVDAAIVGRTAAEARAFVRGISGARGDMYDYLAEEVVADLDTDVQSFLMRTSILQMIDIANSALVTEFQTDQVRDLIATAERVGLLGRR